MWEIICANNMPAADVLKKETEVGQASFMHSMNVFLWNTKRLVPYFLLLRAERKKINFAVIIGEDEVRAGQAAVKNLVTRKQQKVKIEKLVAILLEEFSKLA